MKSKFVFKYAIFYEHKIFIKLHCELKKLSYYPRIACFRTFRSNSVTLIDANKCDITVVSVQTTLLTLNPQKILQNGLCP